MGFFTKSAVITVLLAVLVYYIPSPPGVTFTSYDIPDVAENFKVPPNNILDNAEKIFENEVYGPEGLTVYKDKLYFSAHGGSIFEYYKGSLKKVLQLNKNCGEFWDETNCGRPLGIKFHTDGKLYIAAVNFGILKANISTGTFEQAVPELEGLGGVLPNSLDVGKDGTIYWSESSKINTLENGFYILMADANGRVMKYDPVSKQSSVLFEKLLFTNGVALSPDGNTLFVAETGMSRVHKLVVNGPNKGHHSVFIDRLPGYPDNLQINSRGHLVVSIIDPFYSEMNIMQFLATKPYIRKFVYHLLYSIDTILDKVIEKYPLPLFEKWRHAVGHIETTAILSPKRALIIEMNMKGQIIKSYSSTDGLIGHICDMVEYDGYYYLGSPYNHYLARKSIPKS